VLLLRPFAGQLVDRADVVGLTQLLLVLEGLAARAVPAGVLAAVDGVPAVGRLRAVEPVPELEDSALVDVLRRADEAVVADVEPRPEGLEPRRELVAVLLLGDTALARDPLDVLAVLVRPRQEERVLAQEPAGPGQRVGRDRRVRVAHVGRRVHVVDGRRDVIGPWRGHGVITIPSDGPTATPPGPRPRPP